MKISVIGTGYLGATHAACMASLGHDVLGVDINEDRAEALNSGRSFFHEPGLNDLLTQGMQSGRLQFTTDLHRAAEHAHVHFLTVGTPQQQDSYRADTRAIEEVTDALVPLLDGEHLIIGKSTVPVGTAQQLCQRIDETRCASGERSQVKVCWNPEFLREGHAVEDTLHPDRIVLGLPDPAVPTTSTENTGSTENATIESLIRSIYSLPLAGDAEHDAPPLLVMNLPTAELVKVSANAYLATRVSFINAVGEVCEATGADVDVLSRALGADPRIGAHYLHAGLGFGGGCLPKDIRAFIASATDLGIKGLPEMLRVVESVNLGQRETLFSLVSESFGDDLRGRRITMLGASFKPGSDDLRDSPALAVARRLHQAGAHVTVYDPVAFVDVDVRIPWEIAELSIASTIAESLAGAEAVVVGTEWSEFRKLDPAVAFDWVSRPVIFDGRNCLSRTRWTSAGWSFHALGHQ